MADVTDGAVFRPARCGVRAEAVDEVLDTIRTFASVTAQ
jgi:hypothetical protein